MRQGKVINEELSLMGVPKGCWRFCNANVPLASHYWPSVPPSFAPSSLSVPFSLGQKQGWELSLRCRVFKNILQFDL